MLSNSDRILAPKDNTSLNEDAHALLVSASEAVEKARGLDQTRLAQALTTYARLLTRDGQYERAQAFAAEVLQIEPDTRNAAEATVVLGMCAAYTNHLDEAEQYFHRAAEVSRKANYPIGLARSLQYQASLVLLVRGQYQVALTMLEEVNILREEQGAKHWNEPVIRGMIYQTIGDRQRCRRVLDELVLQIEPGTRLATAYYFLWARLAMDEGELDQAKEYLRLGLRVANRTGNIDLNLWIRLEHSRYHRLKDEAPVAKGWAEDALHMAQQGNLTYFAGLAFLERAQAQWACGDPTAAFNDLDEAQRLFEPMRAAYDLMRVFFLRALWLRQSEQPEADAAWIEAATCITRNGYAFLLEKEQDVAFPLIAGHVRSKNPQVRKITEDLLRHLANVPPPPLRIATLGQFAVWKGRQRIPDQAWTRRKAGELMRYLLLQPNRAVGREVIIEALWPDHASDSPADLLHQATSALRHALEPDLPDKFPSRYLKVEGEQIALVLPASSVVDFEHFERVLPQATQTRSPDRLQEALNLYSGDLFPSDRYADWSEEKRQVLAELRQRGLLALARAYLDQGQYYQVINCCRQVLHSDSWNEDAVMMAMQAYAGLRDIPHALRLYKELEKTLWEELDIVPHLELRELANTLRKR